eukprot:TRINITY_DN7984_c0_g1_i1.p1 TRINITY_DN7984_c0_g1~~TRINITY_DN7984_c0_g1_i1.p1  ORF type:complete len:141 (-),score=39.38 TRINITY_DN7984_c0_g1_i1:123-545(-)
MFVNAVAANTGKAIGAWWQQTFDKPKRSSAPCQDGSTASIPLQQLSKADQVCAERVIMAQQQQQQRRQHQRQRSLSLSDLRVDTALARTASSAAVVPSTLPLKFIVSVPQSPVATVGCCPVEDVESRAPSPCTRHGIVVL